ncbi:MAG: hypothetical protein A2X86_18070 [Bdellovibrionales bacterium GWA2_49_15]|nr:MAG: hypothetical protein A2X86_18070 [Bdellovibrionales bacterium GWA2_49_15]
MGIYSMEAAIEAARLEEQAYGGNYSIEAEFRNFSFAPNEVVMDAGCGTGVLSRYIAEHFKVKHIDALDYSDLRLKQAKDLLKGSAKRAIHFHQQNLNELEPKFYGQYDTVICRYVIEHMKDPMLVLENLKKTLKQNGRMIIVELDGVLINLYSNHHVFNRYLEELKGKIQFDMNIGKKVPSYLKRIGLSDIEWSASLVSCQGKNLLEERDNTMKRFIALRDYFIGIFGTKERSEEFQRLYLEEMDKPENTLVFTKYVCMGKNI